MKFDISLFVVVAIFGIAYFLLKLVLFDPLLAILKRRESRIESARTAWEQATATTEAALDAERQRLLSARRDAAARREQLRRDALAQRAGMIADAEADAHRQLEQAAGELAAVRGREEQKLAERSTTLAARISERLVGRAV